MSNTTPEPSGVSAPDLSGQQLLDGGSREADGEQWDPTRPPKADAADDSAGQQADPSAQPGRSLAEGDTLAPQAGSDPTATSPGRSESASGGPGGGEQLAR